MSKSRARSPQAQASHRFYNTARWKALRERQLATEPLCRLCNAVGAIKAAEVVDHVKAHKGSEALFFDASNLRSLCKPCHSGPAQSKDRLGYDTTIGPDGLPVDPNHPMNR